MSDMKLTAKYTEILYNLLNDNTTKTLINNALLSYPLYVSHKNYEYMNIPNLIPTREEINTKILNHYKYREIGFETVGRFIEELEIAMNEIMPYYNQMLYSIDQDFDVIFNVNYQKTRERVNETSGNVTTESSMSNDGKAVSSDTPQGELSITSQNIDNVSYANNVAWNKGNSSANGESSSTGAENESIVETIRGNYGVVSAQELILKYRETIINIVDMIINDRKIKDLFMNVY
jgi:hypothetical protein